MFPAASGWGGRGVSLAGGVAVRGSGVLFLLGRGGGSGPGVTGRWRSGTAPVWHWGGYDRPVVALVRFVAGVLARIPVLVMRRVGNGTWVRGRIVRAEDQARARGQDDRACDVWCAWCMPMIT